MIARSLLLAAALSGAAAAQNPSAAVSSLSLLAGAQAGGRITKLTVEDLKVGKGAKVSAGDRVFITYVGSLTGGSIFDANTAKDANPLTFVVGAEPLEVVKGLDQGIRDMAVGGVRKIKIPASLGYGKNPQRGIPADSDLVFEITLHDVIKKGEEDVLDIKDLRAGTGPAAKKGDIVTVAYTGKLVNGKLIDSTYVSGRKPVEFKLGVGKAIRGIDYGLIGMRQGGKRRLRVPPDLAYGKVGTGYIPALNIVIYEVELLKVARG
jgi:FKBP-type peptidyl-prolyl cis-trans isomerase